MRPEDLVHENQIAHEHIDRILTAQSLDNGTEYDGFTPPCSALNYSPLLLQGKIGGIDLILTDNKSQGMMLYKCEVPQLG